MRVDITMYRRHQIKFDTDSESFVCDGIEMSDKKHSYAMVKKLIDEYLTDHRNFQPITVIHGDYYSYRHSRGNWEPLTITSIRKDGLPQTSKGVISKYDLSNYVLFVSENEPIAERLRAFDRESDALDKSRSTQRKEIESELKLTPLKSVLEAGSIQEIV